MKSDTSTNNPNHPDIPSAISIAKESGVKVKHLLCSHCHHPHYDLTQRWTSRGHSRHLCFACGKFFDDPIGEEAVGLPMAYQISLSIDPDDLDEEVNSDDCLIAWESRICEAQWCAGWDPDGGAMDSDSVCFDILLARPMPPDQFQQTIYDLPGEALVEVVLEPSKLIDFESWGLS